MQAHPQLTIAAVICISVTIFIPDVDGFYLRICRSMVLGGILIDAPFMFRNTKKNLSLQFHTRTYDVCGCNMKMFRMPQLRDSFNAAGFSTIDCVEHDFDLMKLKVLFRDYPAKYLLDNLFRNVMTPPAHFNGISSSYLAGRTLKIFLFFLANRNKYASGEFAAIKISVAA